MSSSSSSSIVAARNTEGGGGGGGGGDGNIIGGNTAADGVFIIERGAAVAAIVRPGSKEPIVCRTYGPGDVFGELAVLKKTQRSASVYAAQAATATAASAAAAAPPGPWPGPGMHQTSLIPTGLPPGGMASAEVSSSAVTCAVVTPDALDQLGFLRGVLVDAAADAGYKLHGGVSTAISA